MDNPTTRGTELSTDERRKKLQQDLSNWASYGDSQIDRVREVFAEADRYGVKLDLNARANEEDITAFDYAIASGSKELVDLFMANGANSVTEKTAFFSESMLGTLNYVREKLGVSANTAESKKPLEQIGKVIGRIRAYVASKIGGVMERSSKDRLPQRQKLGAAELEAPGGVLGELGSKGGEGQIAYTSPASVRSSTTATPPAWLQEAQDKQRRAKKAPAEEKEIKPEGPRTAT